MHLVLLLSFLFNFSYLSSMDIFKAEQDKPFFIVSNNQQLIEVPYEYEVQLKVLHSLKDRVSFKSQHSTTNIALLWQSFKAAKQNNMDIFLKNIVGNIPRINIENEMIALAQPAINESKENVFFKQFIQLEHVKQMKEIHTLMSVAYDLQATNFGMLCIPYIIDAPSQNKLFSMFISPKERLKFEKSISKYVVAKSKKEMNEDEFDIQDTILSTWMLRAHVSPCENRIIKIINNQIHIYNAQNILLLQLSDEFFKGNVVNASFCRDGKRVVGVRHNPCALHDESVFLVWNAENGKLLVELPFAQEVIFAGLNYDGTLGAVILKYFGSNGMDNWEIVAIDLTNHVRPRIINRILSREVKSLYFRNDNTIAFYGDSLNDNCRYLWDLNAGKKMIDDLNFAQKIFLYQVYESTTQKKTFVSLMMGFVKDSVERSLPTLLKHWVFSR